MAHRCAHPWWHRVLMLCGTLVYCYGAGLCLLRYLDLSVLWIPVAWLVSTWLVKHLLQWRCRGAPRAADFQTPMLVIAASLALLARTERD
jgi:hypothetical protein